MIIRHTLSFKIVGSDGSIIISSDVAPSNWSFLQTFEGSNF